MQITGKNHQLVLKPTGRNMKKEFMLIYVCNNHLSWCTTNEESVVQAVDKKFHYDAT